MGIMSPLAKVQKGKKKKVGFSLRESFVGAIVGPVLQVESCFIVHRSVDVGTEGYSFKRRDEGNLSLLCLV